MEEEYPLLIRFEYVFEVLRSGIQRRTAQKYYIIIPFADMSSRYLTSEILYNNYGRRIPPI